MKIGVLPVLRRNRFSAIVAPTCALMDACSYKADDHPSDGIEQTGLALDEVARITSTWRRIAAKICFSGTIGCVSNGTAQTFALAPGTFTLTAPGTTAWWWGQPTRRSALSPSTRMARSP
jgi:hypothetical protein